MMVDASNDTGLYKMMLDASNDTGLYKMLDASNDTELYKMFPITIRIFNVNFGRVMTKFYEINMKGRGASTAQALFDILAKNGV